MRKVNKKLAGSLVAAAMLLLLYAGGCDRSNNAVNPVSTDDGDNSNRPAEIIPAAAGYPNYCSVLNVRWICQVPPKLPEHTMAQAWVYTNNCGQALGVSLGNYFNNGALAAWVIDEENRWLHYPLPYGSGTSASTLISLLWNFHAVHAIEYHSVGGNVLDVINEVVNNRRPTIACVTIKGGTLVPRGTSGSRTHWVLVVGWDGNVVFHDPGTSSGSFKRISVSGFQASWNFNYCYIPTWK